jgi:hypothetical protein
MILGKTGEEEDELEGKRTPSEEKVVSPIAKEIWTHGI